jgi:inhibitor of KinA sporulation pathway (predicted exonuclease)
MAMTISEEKEIAFLDGTVIKVRPLKISLLKKFMEKFDTISEVATDNTKSMNVLVECAIIAMQQYSPEHATVEKLEEVIDLPTLYAIINEASGIDLTGRSLLGDE